MERTYDNSRKKMVKVKMSDYGHKKGIQDDQMPEIIERYKSGESACDLARDFNVAITTIRNRILAFGATMDRDVEPLHARVKDKDMKAFMQKARKLLYRKEAGKFGRTAYDEWKDLIVELEEKKGFTHEQAFLQACKDFPVLWKLFSEYDIAEFDPCPDSHSGIRYSPMEDSVPEKEEKKDAIENLNHEQSHRENLNWAIAAAGEFKRTGTCPTTCPNNHAYFLYRQAIDEPKDFLGRFTQAENKSSDELSDVKRSSQRSIREIDAMLTTLGEEESDA